MRQSLKRLALAALLGLALALGAVQAQQVAQQPAPVQVADPGSGTGGQG